MNWQLFLIYEWFWYSSLREEIGGKLYCISCTRIELPETYCFTSASLSVCQFLHRSTIFNFVTFDLHEVECLYWYAYSVGQELSDDIKVDDQWPRCAHGVSQTHVALMYSHNLMLTAYVRLTIHPTLPALYPSWHWHMLSVHWLFANVEQSSAAWQAKEEITSPKGNLQNYQLSIVLL